jgi:hypothetical protein
MARMTNEQYESIFEESDTVWMRMDSIRACWDVLLGRTKSCKVYDTEGDLVGTFTFAKFKKAWTQLANAEGYSGVDYYESGEPDAITYNDCVQIAICGEVVYG